MTYLQKKKLAFMSIVNSVKGFVRTVAGIPPLALPDCVDEDSIINYTISGNSVQDGAPSPDNPIEIESVGEKTVNLFDVNNPSLITGYISSNKLMGYVDKFDNTSQTATIFLNIKPNTDYTVSRKLLGARFNVGVSPYAPAVDIAMTKYVSGATKENLTIISGENDRYLYVWFYNKNYDTYTYQELMQEIQIVEGTEVLPYEPYGYKIPVKVSGKNLINPTLTSDLGFEGTASAGYTLVESANRVSNIIEVTPNTTLYLSGDLSDFTNSRFRYGFSKEYPKVGDVLESCSHKGTNQNITVPENCYYMVWSTQYQTYNQLTKDVQLELGETESPYEPYVEPITTNIYLNEPLRKVGNYAEKIDCETHKVVNPALITKVLTGDESWTLRSGKANTYQYWYGTPVNGGFCSHYQMISTSEIDAITGIVNLVNTSYFIISDLNCSSVAEFKAFLKAEYNKGTPVTIVTRKNNAEPIETDIDLPKLPTFKGTTIYSIETTVQPSNISATYYSTSKGD